MTPELEEYILTHIDKEDELLASLDRNTHLYHLRPRMVSGHLQGRILKMFCRMIRPHRILELGTFTGYSALCLAEGLTEGGEVHTIEIDDEIEDFTRSYFDKSPLRDRIKLIIGDASDIIPTLTDTYDIVFIDANKRDYLKYYELVLPKVRPEGFILADNTLWDGKVVTDQPRCPNHRNRTVQRLRRDRQSGRKNYTSLTRRTHDLMEKTIISPDIRGKTLLFIKTTYYGNNQTKQNKPTAPKRIERHILGRNP